MINRVQAEFLESTMKGAIMNNLTWHTTTITKPQRAAIKNQKPCVLWLTGLSGSGKSTLANALERELFARGIHTYLLDGDNVRMGLNKDLGFDNYARIENIRRVGEVCKLFVDSGLIVISAFISPFASDRALARALVEQDEFIEIFINTPLAVCEQRDPKGLYKKARKSEIANFSGITSPYEIPNAPEICLDGYASLECNTESVLTYLSKQGYIYAAQH